MRKLFTLNSFRILCILLFLQITFPSFSQYFGRNKVLYRNFPFRVIHSGHFEIYHYLQNETVRKRWTLLAEQWYAMHRSVLKDSFSKRNPLMFYNHHADFQQTRVIGGIIDPGTGGVTEALKNRVVMPLMESVAQTDHVLGHELVHAFQYHLIKDSLNLNAFRNLPLWMVEGLAEFLSTGYDDSHTAMWMRAAVEANQLPALKDLSNRPDLYFPYRWGAAFWAYVSGQYGENVIRKLFLETGRKGYAHAIKTVLGCDEKTFSAQWQSCTREWFNALKPGREATPPGYRLLSADDGKLNLLPSLSPDGKWLAFWSEKNVISLDLFIADAQTGEVLKRITSRSRQKGIDHFNRFESSIAWSPDSRRVAFVAFGGGRNQLLMADISGKESETFELPGLFGFSNPAWSPDGQTIVVTGIADGQTDLYAYHFKSGRLKQLTRDIFSELLPSFSPDGKWIAFSTDRAEGGVLPAHRYAHRIALLNLQTGKQVTLPVFEAANNMNPVFAPGGNLLYFLSDQDGFRDLYSWDLGTSTPGRLTRLFTGISGITLYAPALTVSSGKGELVYSVYRHNAYHLYKATPDHFQSVPITENGPKASLLPPATFRNEEGLVQHQILNPPSVGSIALQGAEVPYKPKFSLDHLGSTGGIQTGGGSGTGLAGGVGGVFSDMKGDHQVYGALSLNGEILDVAAQFAYINQKHRFNWGVSASHIPYLSGAQYVFRDSILNKEGDTIAAFNYTLDLLRTFEDQFSVFASYPFSSFFRVEAGATFARYYYRMDRYNEFYDEEGSFLWSEKKKADVPRGFSIGQAYLAMVSDRSLSGVASPLAGHRFRAELGTYTGVVKMHTLLADYRKYFRLAPFTLAGRTLFMGRFGQQASNGLLPPLFLGYSFMVRGYDALGYANGADNSLTINDLVGSRIFVSNAEIRFPLSGPERLSAVKSRIFLSELNLFADGGIAWGNSGFVHAGGSNHMVRKNTRWIISTGLSLRLNLFGYLVIEPFYAIPWQNGGWNNRSFGLNVIPGW